MLDRRFMLPGGGRLLIREGTADDAAAVLDYLERVSSETNFISFGPGEFGKSLAEEVESLNAFRENAHQLYLLGLVDREIVSALNFTAGVRPRVRHCGEFGLTVRQKWWGHGIGSKMLDTLIEWARSTGFVRKINLRVRADNERAIALYTRKGFVTEGTITGDFHVDGIDYDHQCMGLKL